MSYFRHKILGLVGKIPRGVLEGVTKRLSLYAFFEKSNTRGAVYCGLDSNGMS